jgi:dienelactone hydrolase
MVVAIQHNDPFVNGAYNSKYNVSQIRESIQFARANLPIDPTRMYISGISSGATSALEYMTTYHADPLITKALLAAPFTGDAYDGIVEAYIAANVAIPTWTFIVEGDVITNADTVKSLHNMQNTQVTVFQSLSEQPAGVTAELATRDLGWSPAHFAGWVVPFGNLTATVTNASFAPFHETIFAWLSA